MELKNLSSNWKKLQASLNSEKSALKAAPHGVKRKVSGNQGSTIKKIYGTSSTKNPVNGSSAVLPRMALTINEGLSPTTEVGRYIAIDCEMVGVGPNGTKSVLARVSIVNFRGDQVYDSYVKPKETVTDWRTHVSGIAPKHMVAARSFETVQTEVARIIEGKVIIGHSLQNDFDALLLSHPKRDIRDTARYPPYRQLAGGSSPRLKILASELLGFEIQSGEHSSVEDARACMLLYQRDKDGFERNNAKKWPTRNAAEVAKEDVGIDGNLKKKKKGRKK